MKKLFALLLALALVLSCAALAENAKVYLITMDLFDAHWVAVDQGCKDAAEELGGIDYVWTGPTQGKDDAAQIECINNAYADGADVILLASNGPDTQVATLEEIYNEGVKIIYVDSPANFDGALATLATDNKQGGFIAGQQFLAEAEARGVTEGKVGVINCNPATVSTVLREEGFREALEGSNFEFLETQYSEGQAAKSQEIANNFIAEGVVGIFGANEGCAVGLGNANAENDNAVIAVGFDKTEALYDLVRQGSLLCTCAQNPYVMGYEGMKMAKAALDGQTEFEDVDTGVYVIDAAYIAENIDNQ